MAEEVKEEQAKLHRQANFDPLTGLPNRMMAFDRINQEIHRAQPFPASASRCCSSTSTISRT